MYDDQGAMCPFKEHKYISDGDWQPPSDTEKGDWCPLRPLPEKRGRLIDGDALREKMYHDAFETDSEMQRWDSGCWIRYKMFENNIDDAETIVEAEGE
jgi:hypothetical protein